MNNAPPGTRRALTLAVTALAAFTLAGCANDTDDDSEDGAEEAAATADLVNVQGDPLGQAEFSFGDGTTEISVDAENLDAGFYGLHIHEIGECEPDSEAPDGSDTGNFMSAGSHIPGEDGADHPEHAGDLPVLMVNDDGTAQMSVVTDRLEESQLFDFDGAAVMIHSAPDNYGNVPERYLDDGTTPDDDTLSTGDAGDRIGCGVIEG